MRTLEITCVTAAFFILWSAVRRLRLVEKPIARVMMLLLLSTEFGVIVAYRTGRYDGMGFLILASTLWAMSITSTSNGIVFLFVLYLFVPWVGLQYLPLKFTIALVTVLLFQLRYWKEIAVSFVASGIGGLAFLAGLWFSGRLPGFMKLVHVQRRGFISNLFHGRFDHHNAIPADYSLLFVFVAAVVLLAACRQPEFYRAYLTLRYAVIFTLCLAIVLISTSKFPTYYIYMVAIPLLIGICSGLSVCKNSRSRIAAATLCALSSIVGVGTHLIAYSVDHQDRDFRQVVLFVDQTIRPDDVVFSDEASYLAVVGPARQAYMPLADWDIIELMSDEQKNSVNVLLVRQDWLNKAIREFGGQWSATGQELVPSGHILLDGKEALGFLSIPDNHLMVFRRQ